MPMLDYASKSPFNLDSGSYLRRLVEALDETLAQLRNDIIQNIYGFNVLRASGENLTEIARAMGIKRNKNEVINPNDSEETKNAKDTMFRKRIINLLLTRRTGDIKHFIKYLSLSLNTPVYARYEAFSPNKYKVMIEYSESFVREKVSNISYVMR